MKKSVFILSALLLAGSAAFAKPEGQAPQETQRRPGMVGIGVKTPKPTSPRVIVSPSFDAVLQRAADSAQNAAATTPDNDLSSAELCLSPDVCLPDTSFDAGVRAQLNRKHPHASLVGYAGLIGHEMPEDGGDENYWYYYYVYDAKSTFFHVVKLTYSHNARTLKAMKISDKDNVVLNKRVSQKDIMKKVENLRRDLLKCQLDSRTGNRSCSRAGLYDRLDVLAEEVALPLVSKIELAWTSKGINAPEGDDYEEVYLVHFPSKLISFSGDYKDLTVKYQNGRIQKAFWSR